MDVPLSPVREGWLVVTVWIVSYYQKSGANSFLAVNMDDFVAKYKQLNLGNKRIMESV